MNVHLQQLHQQGRCSHEGSHELFFSDQPAELAAAQRICDACPVKVQCLEVALRDRHEWGVWGGVIFWDGQPYYRRRSRGRPSRADAHLPVEADPDDLWELVKTA